MNELTKFSEQLRLYLKDYPKSRPFVCDGNPLETEMSKKFENYWNEDSGFDKKKWLGEYENERRSLGKKETSPTRERINRISEAKNIFMETNIYFIPTTREKDLKSKDKGTIFKFLLEEIKPTVILLHGRKAVKIFNRLVSTSLIINEKKKVNIFGTDTIIVTRPHLSRMSYPAAVALGKALKNEQVN